PPVPAHVRGSSPGCSPRSRSYLWSVGYEGMYDPVSVPWPARGWAFTQKDSRIGASVTGASPPRDARAYDDHRMSARSAGPFDPEIVRPWWLGSGDRGALLLHGFAGTP